MAYMKELSIARQETILSLWRQGYTTTEVAIIMNGDREETEEVIELWTS